MLDVDVSSCTTSCCRWASLHTHTDGSSLPQFEVADCFTKKPVKNPFRWVRKCAGATSMSQDEEASSVLLPAVSVLVELRSQGFCGSREAQARLEDVSETRSLKQALNDSKRSNREQLFNGKACVVCGSERSAHARESLLVREPAKQQHERVSEGSLRRCRQSARTNKRTLSGHHRELYNGSNGSCTSSLELGFYGNQHVWLAELCLSILPAMAGQVP